MHRGVLLLVFSFLAACTATTRLDGAQFVRSVLSSPLISVPGKCRDEMEEGVRYPVELAFNVDADGLPYDVNVTQSSNECLAREAKIAIERSVFDPQALTGLRIANLPYVLRVNFSIDDNLAPEGS